MKKEQVKASGLLVFSNLVINLTGFIRQIIMAAFLGISGDVDLLLLSMIVPAIIQSMIGGGAGEILVIKRDQEGLKEGSFEAVFITSCLAPVLILGGIYFFSIKLLLPFFGISAGNIPLFTRLSGIFLLSMLPGTFTSVLRPHLYSKGLYRFYMLSTIISNLAGIAFILITVKQLGIFSFAWGYLFTSLLNAVWYSFRSGLYLPGIFSPVVWKHELGQLVILLRRVFSLSVQTLLNNFATFWERSLSVKYLSAGYLSSLNYSKTLAELPNSVLMSSILTTSYIEQTRLHKESNEKFISYTESTLKLLINAGFMLQAIMLILAPAIIILVFRRGRFDNEAVKLTLVIFNILTVGFLPRLIMNYFSRTMYILGEYKRLLYGVFFKFLVQVSIMIAFISLAANSIPFAIVAGYLFLSLMLFINVARMVKLPSIRFFIARLLIVSLSSVVLLIIHEFTIDLYIERSNLQILLFSLPVIAASLTVIIVFLDRNGIDPGFIIRLKSLFWKRTG